MLKHQASPTYRDGLREIDSRRKSDNRRRPLQPTFQCLTLPLDEVTELHHVHRARQGTFTTFNFRSGNLVRRGQELRGQLGIHAGMRITAVLRVRGRWETLVAWRFDDDGREVWKPGSSPAASFTWFILATLASAITGAWIVLGALQDIRPAFGLGFGGFCLVLVVWKPFFDWRNSKKIAAALRAHKNAA